MFIDFYFYFWLKKCLPNGVVSETLQMAGLNEKKKKRKLEDDDNDDRKEELVDHAIPSPMSFHKLIDMGDGFILIFRKSNIYNIGIKPSSKSIDVIVVFNEIDPIRLVDEIKKKKIRVRNWYNTFIHKRRI